MSTGQMVGHPNAGMIISQQAAVEAAFDNFSSPVPPTDGRQWWIDTSGVPDSVAPVVTSFTIPASTDTPFISILSFTATDAYGVTGYKITTSATMPSPTDSGWLTSAPTTHTMEDLGDVTLYAWAKDAAGNVSAAATATITVTSSGAPTVTAFVAPALSATRNIEITTFTATYVDVISGYLITESASTPGVSDAGWTSSAPTEYIASTSGSVTLRAWAKDIYGQVSSAATQTVNVVANSWVDDFGDGTIAPSIWGTVTAASGTITETGGDLVMDCTSGTAAANAAAAWCKDLLSRSAASVFQFDVVPVRSALSSAPQLLSIHQRTTGSDPVPATNAVLGNTQIAAVRTNANAATLSVFYKDNLGAFPTIGPYTYTQGNTLRVKVETSTTQWRITVTDITTSTLLADTGLINWSATWTNGAGRSDYMILGDICTDFFYSKHLYSRAERVS